MATRQRSSIATALRDHIEAIPPGGVAWLSCEQLGQTVAQFAATLDLLADLERGGELRLGDKRYARDRVAAVEIERLD
jgi:hypothetical protein